MATEKPSDDSPPPKRIRIQRKRLGVVRKVDPGGEYGFIEAEDFREDVFFHRTVWQPSETPQIPSPPLSVELEEVFVEFEIDDDLFVTERKLRAKIVRPTDRPRGRKLSGRDATFNIVTHHPNARRRKPRWRK